MSTAMSAAKHIWPIVQGLQETYNFNDPATASLKLIIKEDRSDRPLYVLECHSGLYEGGSDPDFFSGLFDCQLSSLYSTDSVSTLFSETKHQLADWDNRGRFMSDQLLPGCASYPDYGQRRTFRLRGMVITIALSDITFAKMTAAAVKQKLVSSDAEFATSTNEIPTSYKVGITVQRDASAVSSLTQKPKTPLPVWFNTDHPCPH
jgi:hypothetical protein